jgi:hypothetical protein
MAAPWQRRMKQSVPPCPDSSKVKLHEPDVMKKIADAAYYLWEKRGQPHGDDMHDWLEAEKIVLGKTGR